MMDSSIRRQLLVNFWNPLAGRSQLLFQPKAQRPHPQASRKKLLLTSSKGTLIFLVAYGESSSLLALLAKSSSSTRFARRRNPSNLYKSNKSFCQICIDLDDFCHVVTLIINETILTS